MRGELPMFPLSTVLFPHGVLPLHIFEERYQRLVRHCLARRPEFGVVLITRGREAGGGDERASVGSVARIAAASQLPGGRWALLTRGARRIRVDRWLEDAPYPRAVVADLPEKGRPDPALLARAETAVRRVTALLSEAQMAPALPGDLDLGGDPVETAWSLCELAPLTAYDRQLLLAADGVDRRLALLVELVEARGEDAGRILAGG